MAITEVANLTNPIGIIAELGKIGIWLQTLGIVIVFWIIVEIVSLIVNRKKRKALYAIRDDLKRLEKKIDHISKKVD